MVDDKDIYLAELNGRPITPTWCPLKTQPITVAYES